MHLHSFLVIGVVSFSVAVEGKLFEPCFSSDAECLGRSTEKLLKKISNEIPRLDIKALDPLTFSEPIRDLTNTDQGIAFYFENANMTGLKDQKILDLQLNVTAKSVLFKMKADLAITSNIKIELDGKPFTGTYQATGSVLETLSYNYEIQNDTQGVEYFVLGPETMSCEVIGEPVITLSPLLENTLASDLLAISKNYATKKNVYLKQSVCKIAEQGFKVFLHNIKATCKALPTSAFFKDY